MTGVADALVDFNVAKHTFRALGGLSNAVLKWHQRELGCSCLLLLANTGAAQTFEQVA